MSTSGDGAIAQAIEDSVKPVMPTDEHAPAAEDVAQATADDHEHGEGEGVARGPPLHGGRAASELAADGRGGDGDDGAVEQVHDLGDEHDGEHDPAPAVGGALVLLRDEVDVGWGRQRRWRTCAGSGRIESGQRDERCS
jgi:hypothetical protein